MKQKDKDSVDNFSRGFKEKGLSRDK